ncbi:MAG: MFS transporter [Ignavibacteriales bacterium]|nr:MFS transporter [Ignavibacteriales bacterium]
MRRKILLPLIGICIGGIGFGLITPVTVVLLEQNHADSFVTGSVTMIGYISIIIFSSIAGKLIDRFNVKKILTLGLFIWAFGALAHIFWYIYPLLYAIKFIMNIGGTFIFVATEVVINHYSDETNRGKNISLYVVLLSIGTAAGTLLIWTIQIADWLPFVIGSVIMFAVFVFQLIMFDDFEVHSKHEEREKMPFAKMPLVSILSSIVYGLFESSIIVALPMYGLRNGFNANEVSFLLASFVIGGIVLLYIFGMLSDEYDQYNLLLINSFLLGAVLITPALTTNFVFLLVVFFIAGGIIPSFYTIGLNYTVRMVEKKYAVQANGYYIMVYGIGTMAGPIAGSSLVDIDKQYGYWFFASALCFTFLLIFVSYKKKLAVK